MTGIADTARRALEILDEDGWCKGSMQLMMTEMQLMVTDRTGISSGARIGSHCLGGAWNKAVSGRCASLEDKEVYAPLVRVICEQYPDILDAFGSRPDDPGVIMYFNDRKDTAEADIRAVLEKLAAREE